MRIGTWIHEDDASGASRFPQLRATSDELRAKATYWKCIATYFATSLAVNRAARHVLFRNRAEAATVDGFGVEPFLLGHGVEIAGVTLGHRVPDTWQPSFRNQFYAFDVLERVADELADDEVVALLDADCVWIGSADRLEALVRRHGAATYELRYPPAVPVNGVSRVELTELYNRLYGASLRDPLPYLGGEIVAGTGRAIRAIRDELRSLWPEILAWHAADPRRSCDEAHVLSLVYRRLGFEPGTADACIRRIWTGLRHKNADATDLDRDVWHVPAEKRLGIPRLFQRLRRDPEGTLRLLGSDRGGAYLAATFGIPRRGITKWMRDAFQLLRSRLAL